MLPFDNEEEIPNNVTIPTLSLLASHTLPQFFDFEKNGRNPMRLYQIVGFNHFSIALTTKGDLITWGKNYNGCLGMGNDLEDVKNIFSFYLCFILLIGDSIWEQS